MRRVVAVLGVAALIAGACSGGDGEPGGTNTTARRVSTQEPADATTSTTTEPPAPVYGGTVVIGGDQEPQTLNPFAEGGDTSIVATIAQTYLAGVYDVDGTTLQLVPELVTELPTVGNGGVVLNDDGTMTVRWVIRDDAVWSDGVPITAADMVFTWRLMRDPDISGDQWSGLDVVAVNSSGKTFSLTFAAPTVEYETLFRYVVPRHAVEGTDLLTDWNTEMWPSAGPFVFSEWIPGEYIRLTRNTHYWKTDPASGDQLPYLDGVEFRFIADSGELTFQFTQRALDVIQPIYDPDTIKSLQRLESDGAEVQLEAGPIWEHLSFQFGPNNRNPESLNRFLAFRQAVAYTIDPKRIAALVGWAPIYSFLDLHAEEGAPWSQYAFDAGRAKELLAEACAAAQRDCDADPPLAILTTTNNAEERPRIARYLKSALGNVGIQVQLELEDSQVFFGDTLNDGTWDMGWFAWAWNAGATGALQALDHFDPDSAPPEGQNLYRWGTPDSVVGGDDSIVRFRDILSVARGSFDSTQVISLSRAAEQILADNAVIIPVAARQVAAAVWADTLVGFELNPSQAGSTWNIEYWYLRAR
jgi:ABC-type transport system substrate-binding protein